MNIIKILCISVLLACGCAISSFAQSQKSKALSQRYIARLNRHATFIGIGALEIGRDWGIGASERLHPADAVAQQVISMALKKGINIYDTASSYHLSELRLGKAIHIAKMRDQVLIISKPGESSILASDKACNKPSYDKIYCNSPASRYDFSPQAIRSDIEQSLKNLNIPYLDVALIHLEQKTAKKILEKGEAIKTLQQLKKEGKVRFIGVSVDGEEAKLSILSNDLDAIEMEYNLLNQTNEENIRLAKHKGMMVIIRGGLGTGLLTSKVAPYINDTNLPYHEQINQLLNLTKGDYNKLTGLALAFLYKNKDISSVILGINKPEELQQDIKMLDSFNDKQLLQQAEKLMKQYKPNNFTYSVDAYFAK